jgi:O-acetyl-ADP-ribose deacetylase
VSLSPPCSCLFLIYCSRFFPSTEPEPESDWEEVEGGESAENGPAPVEGGEPMDTEPVEVEAVRVELPDVPTAEPRDDGPSPKKQKPNDEEKL